MTTKTPRTVERFDTEYSADSIEWLPDSDFFVCGTYQLQENEDESAKCNRTGRIYLFRYNPSDGLEKVDQIETNAVLDQKWRGSTLAVADSKGFISLFEMKDAKLEEVSKLELEKGADELLALSLDWSKDGRKIVVSDSKGNFSVVGVEESGMSKEMGAKAHEFEMWVSIFDKHRDQVVYTGADDSVLNCFDLRDPSKPSWKNKSHTAGVTSLLTPNSLEEHFLVTGSYDERLRLFDVRQPKSEVAGLKLGGGIWRIKQHPQKPNLLLTANMHHNFAVVNLNAGSFEIEAEYFEHKSICYGADWCFKEEMTFATCSFYDHKMCIATID